MQFIEFKHNLSKYIIFSICDIEKLYPNFNRINLLTWQKKKYIQKIRNSWYSFTDINEDETYFFFIANKIYKPSYISMETALYYYGIIPEAVFTVTSVTSLKTQTFKNNKVFCNYSNIKRECFFGYKLVEKNNLIFKIADMEKSILDFLYLQTSIRTIDDIVSFRFNKVLLQEKLNRKKLSEYAIMYNSKVLIKKIKILNQFIDA